MLCARAEQHAVLFTQGAQARQPLLRLARQLLGVGADGERQWKDGTACARDGDCHSGLCADKVLIAPRSAPQSSMMPASMPAPEGSVRHLPVFMP